MFNQLYAIRIANMMSLITMTQTGKRYFRNEIILSKRSGAAEDAIADPELPDMNMVDHLKTGMGLGAGSAGRRSVLEEWEMLK